MKHFCIIANQEKDPDGRVAGALRETLKSYGFEAYVIAPLVPGTKYKKAELKEGTDCAIILGGDGTFLHGAKALSRGGIPIMGINLGNLGFLTAAEQQDTEKAVRQLAAGEYVIEKRTLLSADCVERKDASHKALNDVVIARSGFSRLIRLRLSVNGQVVQDYQGDGVIIATPTGSTGYSLSAGGPVVSPVAKTLVITPICPHMLSARPLVVSEDDRITVEVLKSSRSMEQEAFVTVDGDEVAGLAVGEHVNIVKADDTISVVMLKDISFWEKVRAKL
ncbi:MAG: NAD(+)/NADH kinase [Lachnospiraceae bacterium]|jgi:NAD+ kinase|nr:NAD(+)/NADH kinase [Lachnospiraceae bacterium]